MTPQIRYAADAGVYGTVAIGWLGLLQPWLTTLATILAITWTVIQLVNWYKKK